MVPSRWPASSCMKSPTPSSTGCAIPRRHSQVPGSSRCAAEGKLERPQPRSGEEEVGFIWVACVFPACWSAEWSRKHPSGAVPVRGGHDHVSGTGLLSQMIERGLPAGSCAGASAPRAWRPSRLMAATAACRRPQGRSSARRGFGVTAAVRGVACGSCCAYNDHTAATVEQAASLPPRPTNHGNRKMVSSRVPPAGQNSGSVTNLVTVTFARGDGNSARAHHIELLRVVWPLTGAKQHAIFRLCRPAVSRRPKCPVRRMRRQAGWPGPGGHGYRDVPASGRRYRADDHLP